jgi:aspartate/methionine/tyrosine aminotransferase
MPELRAALARRIAADRGLPEIDPERVVVFPGARPSIGFAQQAYCERGDEIIYPTPGYPLYESYIPYVGARPVPIHLREDHGFSLTAEELAPLISRYTRLIYLNFPSNPTGGVASRPQLEELAAVILEETPPNVRVYSDEAYEAIVFDGERHVSIASVPGMEARTIIASAVSKTYSWTGGRVGWAVYPTVAEAKVHRNLNINYFASVPPYNQVGARVALESAESAAAIHSMCEAFQRRRDQVVAGLNAIEGIRCQNPKGAFYVFPNIGGVVDRLGIGAAWQALPDATRRETSPATLFQLFLLHRYHVATMDRRSFGRLDSEGQHFLRLSIATGADDLREAVTRIAVAAQDAVGFRAFLKSGVPLVL